VAQTPAVAAAERAGVHFTLHAYPHAGGAEPYGPEAAAKLGVDPARVFKTLVVSLDGALAVACLPVGAQLDLKALGKRAELAPAARAEAATGYVAGGISPLGQRRALPAHLDASALAHTTVFVSAGRRGLELELDPRDLVRLTGTEVRPLAAPPAAGRRTAARARRPAGGERDRPGNPAGGVPVAGAAGAGRPERPRV
jgi:Cys-tRNA(Pro)/Cys-tRNA(Cys) deacylase